MGSLNDEGKTRYRHPYQTRHTYASMMLSTGKHLMWVAKPIRYSDRSTIARIHVCWPPSASIGAGTKAKSC